MTSRMVLRSKVAFAWLWLRTCSYLLKNVCSSEITTFLHFDYVKINQGMSRGVVLGKEYGWSLPWWWYQRCLVGFRLLLTGPYSSLLQGGRKSVPMSLSQNQKKQCQDDADENWGSERKIKSEILFPNDDIPREFANPWNLLSDQKKKTNSDNKNAKQDQHLSQGIQAEHLFHLNDVTVSVSRVRNFCFTFHLRPSTFHFLHKSFFLTIDAPAILLTIQPHFFGDFEPFSPPLSKILIIERDSNLLGQTLPCLLDQLMILVGTLKKSGWKLIETIFLRLLGRCLESNEVAKSASLLDAVRYIS